MRPPIARVSVLVLFSVLMIGCTGTATSPTASLPPTEQPTIVPTDTHIPEPSATPTETLTLTPVPTQTPLPTLTPRATLPVGPSTWQKMSSSSRLPMRGMQAVYDSDRNVVVLFGGTDRNNMFLNQTWEYDGKSWKQVKTAHTPSPRLWSGMTYDSDRRVVVLMGGQQNGGSLLNDTWEYDGKDWSQAITNFLPGQRGDGPGMVYDSCRHKVILFGGKALANPTMTWEYDGKWVPVQTTNSPSERRLTAMVFDPLRCRAILFGGEFNGTGMDDTWEYDGTDWQEIITKDNPAGRWANGMTYDPLTGKVILFGGYNPQTKTAMNDTWVYDGTNWEKISTKRTPAAREQQAMVFFGGTGQIMMIGGYGSDGDWKFTEGFSMTPTPEVAIVTTPNPSCAFGYTRLSVGDNAQPAGEPSLANRIRSAPKIGDNIIAGFTPGMFVTLTEGPVCADGFVFWKVKSRFIPGGVGWTAEGDGINYFLEPLK